jgi:hypothetical protein
MKTADRLFSVCERTYGFALSSTASQSLRQSGGSGATGDSVFGGFDSSSSGNRFFSKIRG